MSSARFPRSLYVKREEDGDEHYFASFESLKEATEIEESVIAVYQLKGTVKAKLVVETKGEIPI